MRKFMTKIALVMLFGLAAVLITGIQHSGGPVRVDLTEDKLFTLSEGTLNTLAALQSEVQIELFFTDEETRDIPVLRNYKRRVMELLQEYVLMSDGKVSLIEVDPKPFSEAEDRAASLGLTPAALSPGMPAVYFGLAATGARAQAELIPFFQPGDEPRLEQSISKAILLAGRPTAPSVAIISSLDIDGGFDQLAGRPIAPWVAIQQLRELAAVQWLPLDVSAIPDDVSALLVIHPNALSAQTRYAID
ncbi:MAG: GldG family protein, partial [Pseudomonadota bacterium]